MAQPLDSLGALVGRVRDGARLALPPDYSGCAMAAIRMLAAQRRRGLRLIGVPQMGFGADMLIGAGCVAGVEAAAVTLGEFGLAPRFAEAVQDGRVAMVDSTCPAIHAGLQAAEKGVPFMPLRGVIGSDLAVHRDDWKVIDNPFAAGDRILVLPAISPDIALFHAPLADCDGNVWIGVRRELMLMAHAARETLVTVEVVREDSLLSDPALAAGTIPALYITALTVVERGAWPLGLFGHYRADETELRRYAELAATAAGFERYLADRGAA